MLTSTNFRLYPSFDHTHYGTPFLRPSAYKVNVQNVYKTPTNV